MSTCSTHWSRSCESFTAPAPCAASVHSSLWPAVAQTNLPAYGGEQLVDRLRVVFLIASPVRITAAAVDVGARDPRLPCRPFDERAERPGIDLPVRQERR